MEIQEGLFWAEDGERLYYRFLAGDPEKKPLILIHGHGEHSGRYLKFFSRLKPLRFSIAAFDLRGCGLSSGEPASVTRFEDYLSDVSSFLHFLNVRFKLRPPVQLFGHSLGGLIAAAWAYENPEKVSKLALSSPLFGIPKENLFQGLVGFLNRWIPGFVVRNPVNSLLLTRDPEEIEKYKNDPLIRKRITVRLVHEMLRYTRLFRQRQFKVPFPVFILMAEKDYVVRPGATHEFFSRIESPKKEIKVFEGFLHEIFNEKDQEQVFQKLEGCLIENGTTSKNAGFK